MRCINMKIIDVLIFSFTLMAVKSVSPPKDKNPQPVNNGNLNKFESDCPDLWKIIQANNLTGWFNCQNKSKTIKLPKEEDVLEFACFLAKNMMVFICDHKLNMTNEYLNSPEKDQICPFQFSHLVELGLLADELKDEEKCIKVCEDLYESRIQCVILKKLNNILKSVELQTARVGIVQPNEKKITTYKADKINDKPLNSKAIKNATNKIKTETTSNKEATSPVGPLSTNETKKPKLESPKFEKPNYDVDEPENFEPKSPESEKLKPAEELKVSPINEESKDLKKDKYLNPEEVSENENLPDASVDVPKGGLEKINFEEGSVEDENEKIRILNQKEISSNDSFLQAEDSHFFFYFIMVFSVIVLGYIGFHNKNKILAYALEGTSGRRSRRRPNPARYRKLETNLEEAISSNTSETVASSVVY